MTRLVDELAGFWANPEAVLDAVSRDGGADDSLVREDSGANGGCSTDGAWNAPKLEDDGADDGRLIHGASKLAGISQALADRVPSDFLLKDEDVDFARLPGSVTTCVQSSEANGEVINEDGDWSAGVVGDITPISVNSKFFQSFFRSEEDCDVRDSRTVLCCLVSIRQDVIPISVNTWFFW